MVVKFRNSNQEFEIMVKNNKLKNIKVLVVLNLEFVSVFEL